jgi:hypothetical protein
MTGSPKRATGSVSDKIGANQPAPFLKTGGGSGTFDGMEARVSALEALAESTNEKLDKLLDEMRKVQVDVARLDGRVMNLPTSIQLLGFVVATFAMAGVFKFFAP